MVRIGHKPVHRYGFHPPGDVGGAEVIDWSTLTSRTAKDLRRPHRTDFHQLLLVDRGTTTHRVDFVDHTCRPGTLLWVRPGQVQQFGTSRRLSARPPDHQDGGWHRWWGARGPPPDPVGVAAALAWSRV